MSQPPFSEENSRLQASFAEILEDISTQKTGRSDEISRTHQEWSSVVENTHLLNHLFTLSFKEDAFRARSATHQSAAQLYRKNSASQVFHKKSNPRNEKMQESAKASIHEPAQEPVQESAPQPIKENVPQPQVNPLWNILVKAAYEKINAPDLILLSANHYRLPVFFTAQDLKKVYRERAKITHPDQATGSHLQFIELKKNIQILMDFLKKID